MVLAPDAFPQLNKAYNRVFRPNRLSLGLVIPLEQYNQPVPTMTRHLERVRLAEEHGFAAVWLRDVPFNVPSFGDAGQLFDPFVYLGYLAAHTQDIALGVASIILPLRHPAHVAKAAASVDVLSQGRVLLGVASGDRPAEYPAMNLSFEQRGAAFREHFDYLRKQSDSFPRFDNGYGALQGAVDMLPKPTAAHLPLLVTGGSQQSPDWLAEHGDGWMTYPRPMPQQAQVIADWRTRTQRTRERVYPSMQPLYIDLAESDDAGPQPIHLGYRLGMRHLRSYLKSLEDIGINHVALNLRFNRANIEQTLDRLAEELLPDFD